jgi:hypothetical protein
MEQSQVQSFWNAVIANIGDQYRPHSAEYGVFLFREKLRSRGFHQEESLKLDPKLVARAVPWATFMNIGTKEFLTLRHYGSRRNISGLPQEAFSCFDEHFQLYLGRFVPEDQNTVNEVVFLTSMSLDRLGELEDGRISFYDAFRQAESGQVQRIKLRERW